MQDRGHCRDGKQRSGRHDCPDHKQQWHCPICGQHVGFDKGNYCRDCRDELHMGDNFHGSYPTLEALRKDGVVCKDKGWEGRPYHERYGKVTKRKGSYIETENFKY